MKNILFSATITVIVLGCGPSKEELEAKELMNSKQIEQQSKHINNNNSIEISVSCNFDRTIINKTVFSFDADEDAKKAVDKICELTALKSNFEIKAADVPNACAVVRCDDVGNCKRYILYNQEFMLLVNDASNTDFSRLGILAHEIAHHLNGHTLTNDGSNWEFELEADKFAGFVLRKLGATLDDVKRVFSILPVEGSITHPPRETRIAAAINGWIASKGGNTSNNSSYGIQQDNRSNGMNTESKRKTKKKFEYEACECGENTLSFVEGEKYVRCYSCHKKFKIYWTGIEDANGVPMYSLVWLPDKEYSDWEAIKAMMDGGL